MTRIAITLAITLLATGCRAPMPSMNVLAPYGTPRVPAPTTGSYGGPSTYYQAPPGTYQAPAGTYQTPPSTFQTPSVTIPPIGTGVRNPSSLNHSGWTISHGSLDRNVATPIPSAKPVGVRGRSVQQANFEQEVALSPSQNSLRSPGDPSTPRFRGMPVNDATRAREPARFRPPSDAIDISQLPRPGQNGATLVAASSVVIPASSNTADVASRAVETTASHDNQGWQTRPLGQTTLRVTGR
jgi:hypothetical protein